MPGTVLFIVNEPNDKPVLKSIDSTTAWFTETTELTTKAVL